ncbi:GIY-YIG nuclease [Candidatus Roizmanbacteria bacterium CG_4_9_14_0_2_um_filter_39_13]|uniref:GIY-YIG nuclease n=2 Tax=Candidatus Roizmaniibacteriota TaxID=1752723 RepID=A0A2M8EY22_9BACT|nr:MAG: GIY-YIG nuclease [Candidatus Roizmanbacteria bacterium CG_4_10_14_0_2_um_filter_39_12]PJC31106.1 MAG: GIY-YIG nuclease [Candidatus Roizmanbacteria bacterium CG_4_9_14_0_2_um_filter_39_13]PJE61436.1 MAG: GIY-YIG nuclease [Candidatus Roizmanbacteria bacterium CG10_big_fil_rev_8_21_14_0_10_39_12]
MNKQYYVYILTNKLHTVLYTGITGNLLKRIWQHKNKVVEGFTEKYNVNMLVYYEVFEDVSTAILREKRLKKWNRQWKERLINEMNSSWNDLYDAFSQ